MNDRVGKKTEVAWVAVEAAMRRSARGRASEQDNDLCARAYRVDSAKYAELSRRVRGEEFEAEKRRYHGLGGTKE